MSGGNGKIGDWDRVERMLSQAGSKFKSNIQAATNKSGRLLERAIVGRIEDQKLSPALKDYYRRWKVKKGLSEQILIATGTLLQAIRYHMLAWNEGFVGVGRNVRGTIAWKGGRAASLINIAAVHEFGTRDGRVPARPYIGPALAENEDRIVRIYEEAVEKTFRQ